jgi:acyl-CoA synthetase (AMP-forming)/AMP-acid ligase II
LNPVHLALDTRATLSAAAAASTLVDALRQRAETQADRVAFRFVSDHTLREQTVTYAELDRRARTLAAELARRGARGGRALLLHPPGLEYISALIGCFYAGVIAVPAYPPGAGRPMARLAGIVEDAHAEWALSTARALESVMPLVQTERGLTNLQWIASDQLDGAGAGPLADLVAPATDSLALLQYTSGSTSAPKGVMVSHGNFVHNIKSLFSRAGMNSEDRVVAWLPPYHDMGLVGAILLPLYMGVQSILITPSTFLKRPGVWLSAITQFGGTVSGGPNFGYELCVRRLNAEQRAAFDLRNWRVAFSGAERVSPDTLQRFADAFGACGFDPKAYAPCYGLAEATLGVSFAIPGETTPIEAFDAQAMATGRARPAQPGEASCTLVGCGPALDGVEIRIVDPDTSRPKAAGETGEIWVQSPSVAGGYWNQPELSQETFAAALHGDEGGTGRYLRTGDLGFMRGEQLFVTGRIKDLIILGGVNYYPEDIETTVARCHAELHGAVAAFSVDHESQERLVVICEINAKREASDDEMAKAVRKAVADKLELAVHDVLFVRAGGLPRTSSGKLQRRLSRQLYIEGRL